MALKLSVDLIKMHNMKKALRSTAPSMPMRFVQFRRSKDPQKHLGVVSEDGKTLVPLSMGSCCSNDMITFITQRITPSEIEKKIRSQPAEEVNEHLILLPPVTHPEKIIGIESNYKPTCRPSGIHEDRPLPPTFFSKYASSLIGPTGNVIAHPISEKIDWEVQLAVIIGKTARNVPKSKAFDYVFGYTAAQDISARDWENARNGGQYLIGKSMDTFCPLGPAIVHKSLIEDPHNLHVITKVNGVHKQYGNTKDMIYKIDEIIHRLTKSITLKPGDVILTGTPDGVGAKRNPPEYLRPGDLIETEVQSIGRLINKVVRP